ncbi:hypothetical protein [Arthrobacter sp. efr-133-R2A-63]|uniref:hypothetical protein n=1 Tax=Arthrobacter sp. efr-133-R2A-63 TaxID=3040278 RepID=UPI00254BA25C|nr:hypothetical protein [Arthrobacter sp. efr-133-R2A-63]
MSGLNQSGEPEPDPVVVPDTGIDWARAVRAHQAVPVWVRLTFDDERPACTEKGFACAWTDQHVLVQVLWELSYYRRAREFWVHAGQVKRRVVERRWLDRSA